MRLFGADPETTLPEWSDADYEVARNMRVDGKSSSEIAAAFGNPRARNSVIGRLARKFGRMAPRVRVPTARTVNAAAAAERRAERQRAMDERRAAAKTPRTLAEVRERQAAIGRALIAKVEAQQKHVADIKARIGSPRFLPPPGETELEYAGPDLKALGKARYRPVLAVDNPAFVKVEPTPDLYSHMRSERGLSAALAALTRDRKTGEIFHGQA